MKKRTSNQELVAKLLKQEANKQWDNAANPTAAVDLPKNWNGADLVVAEHVHRLLTEFKGDREAAAEYADERAATARFGTGPVWRDVARKLRGEG